MAMENFLVFSPVQFFTIAHVLSLGFAAMLAGLVYFLATSKQVAPRYRLGNVLSAVVMASAVLELGNQYFVWTKAMRVIETGGDPVYLRAATDGFSNGYRYVNWSIDVPVLLTQLLIVLGLSGKRLLNPMFQFTFAGLAMVYTGYVGQYYQAQPATSDTLLNASTVITAANETGFAGGLQYGQIPGTEFVQSAPYWIWFVVSCLFYLWILVLVVKYGLGMLHRLPPSARPWMKAVAWLLITSWMLYPLAYLMPFFSFSPESAVTRQILYTIADITSKVIYGVLLGVVAQKASRAAGYVEEPSGALTDDAVERAIRGEHVEPIVAGHGGAAGRTAAEVGSTSSSI